MAPAEFAVAAEQPQQGNPFFHRGPVRDPAAYFGRALELARAGEILRSGQHLALCGQRRLGKTSLVLILAQPAVAANHGLAPQHTHWAYLDCGMLDGLDETWLYGAIERSLGGERDTVEYGKLIESLRALGSSGRRLIVVLDEFELLAANVLIGQSVFNRLRGLAAHAPLQFVTISKSPLFELVFAHPEALSSPFFNIFAAQRLSLLSDLGARELLDTLSANGGRPFAASLRDQLQQLAGPHPLFLQLAGYHAFAALEPDGGGVLAETAWQAARAQIELDIEPHLRYYWSHLSEDERYTLACMGVLSPELHPAALDRLQAEALLQGRRYAGTALERFVRRQVISGVLQAGPIVLDTRRGSVAAAGVPVSLTPTELAALRLFIEWRGELLTPEAIEAALWPGEFATDPERVRGVVKKLRAALGTAGDLIVNRRGQGYLLEG